MCTRCFDDATDGDYDDMLMEHGRRMQSEAALAAAKTFQDIEPWEGEDE